MRIFKILIAIAVFGSMFYRCQLDDELAASEYYYFKTLITTTYKADTISMGDTLWFESEVGGYLYDTATQKNIHFKKATIMQQLILRAWNIENQNYQPDNSSIEFRTYANSISYTDKAAMIVMYYYSSAGKYKLKVGVVFHNPGIYSIDADYLKFLNYYNNTEQYFGGGQMQLQNLDNVNSSAYVYAEMVADSNNIHLYNNLSVSDKNSFQVVDETNQAKYFFIKVNE